MRLSLALAAILTPIFGLPALAEVTGGQIGLSYSAFTDQGSINRTSVDGALEYSFGSAFSVQGDLAHHSFGTSAADITTLTLHGIYHLDDQTSLGAFMGRDDSSTGGVNLYGLEAGRDLGRIDIEGYLGGFNGSGDRGVILGADGRYAYSPEIGFGAGFDYIQIDSNLDLTRFGINADYQFINGPALSAEIGQLKANAFGLSGTEAYAKIGVDFKFGDKRGATFGNRSVTRVLPGL